LNESREVGQHYDDFEALVEPDELLEGHPLLSYVETSDPDTMYLHQAMKEPDKAQFLEA
jgi:hypothetical protein